MISQGTDKFGKNKKWRIVNEVRNRRGCTQGSWSGQENGALARCFGRSIDSSEPLLTVLPRTVEPMTGTLPQVHLLTVLVEARFFCRWHFSIKQREFAEFGWGSTHVPGPSALGLCPSSCLAEGLIAWSSIRVAYHSSSQTATGVLSNQACGICWCANIKRGPVVILATVPFFHKPRLNRRHDWGRLDSGKSNAAPSIRCARDSQLSCRNRCTLSLTWSSSTTTARRNERALSMPNRSKNKEYYAVIRGFYLTVPTIFSSW